MYVHIPFCFHKCHYCDFYSIVDRPGENARQAPFTDRLIEEIDALAPCLATPLQTVFVGGGTPTLLGTPLWERLLDALHGLPLDATLEFTVEANPETITATLAWTLACGGVNRVSVGCQSFDPTHLRTLERWHDPANVRRSVKLLRDAGIENLNLDLIFGIPGQTLADWESDLEQALLLDPAHISCYALTYEPNTPMTVRLLRGELERADEDLEASMYEMTLDRLETAGFEQYEISAWALPGRRCRHNLLYWTNSNWWPLGPGASGHVDGLRWKNVPRLAEYLEPGPWPPVTEVEHPDAARRVAETLLLGLRLRDGLPRDAAGALVAQSASPARLGAALDRHLATGLLEHHHDRLRLSRRGLLLADTVLVDLV